LFTARYLSSAEIFTENNFDRNAQETALLYGRIWTIAGQGTLTASVGLSDVTGLAQGDYLGMGERCGFFDSNCKPEPQYAENHFRTLGIPIQGQWIGHSRFIGFGLSFDADLNLEMPLFGVTLNLPFGYLPF